MDFSNFHILNDCNVVSCQMMWRLRGCGGLWLKCHYRHISPSSEAGMLWNLLACSHEDRIVPLIFQCWSLLSRRKMSLRFHLKLRQTTFSIRVTVNTRQTVTHIPRSSVVSYPYWRLHYNCTVLKTVPQMATSGSKSPDSNSTCW